MHTHTRLSKGVAGHKELVAPARAARVQTQNLAGANARVSAQSHEIVHL